MTYVLYGYSGSGNCYKVELCLTQLGRDFRWQEIDISAGESRSAEFLAINPNGKVPVLELPTGEFVTESNAALCHLAEGSPLMPAPGLDRTRVLEWLFFEQYSHEPYIAVLRAAVGLGLYQLAPERQAELLRKGYMALELMEHRLGSSEFLAGGSYTIADIALFAYTHVASDGGFDMTRFPAIGRWLGAVKKTSRYCTMPAGH